MDTRSLEHLHCVFCSNDLQQWEKRMKHSVCSQLVHSVSSYVQPCYKPILNWLCCSPSRFQSIVTLIASAWQVSHSCQGDTVWLLMTITDKMRIRQKGSVRGEMRWGYVSASLVREKRRVNEETVGGKKRRLKKMKCRRKAIASKQL